MPRIMFTAAICAIVAIAAGCSQKTEEPPPSQWGALYATAPVVAVAYSPSYDVFFAAPRETGFRYWTGSTWYHYLTCNSGICSNDCRSIAVDGSGYVWIATDRGVAIFNGATFSWATKSSTGGGLPDDDVRAVFCDSAGRMWVGTAAGASYYTSSGGWVTYTTVLGSLSVTAIGADSSGNVWIGHDGAGCTRLRIIGGVDYYTTAAGMSSGVVTSIFGDSSGLVWIGTPAGLNRFNGSSFSVYTTVSGAPSNVIRCLVEDGGGSVWCATDQGLGCYSNGSGSWTNYSTSNSSLPSDDLWSITRQPANAVFWIGSSAGVSRFQTPSSWSTAGTGNTSLPSNTVLSFAEDGQGTTWFGTDSGLTRVIGSNWTTFNVSNTPAMGSNPVRALAGASSCVWVGSDTGLRRYDGTSWNLFDQVSGDLPSNLVRDLAFCGDALWIATAAGLVKKDAADLFTAYDTAAGLASNDVRALATDGISTVYAATAAGLSVFDGTTWTSYSSASSPALPADSLTDVAYVEGGFWVATASAGAARFDGTAVTAFNQLQGNLPSDECRAVCASDSRVFIATSKGLACFENGAWSHLTESTGQILQDDMRAAFLLENGDFYFCTASAGISAFRP